MPPFAIIKYELTSVTKLINEWCLDDNGRNILYKSTGEERYPDFKLYRMIAKCVNKHIPSEQINKDIFSHYKIVRKALNRKAQNNVLNIDKIQPQY